MKKLDNNTLFIGIGNNTRQDDGLGWCFLDLLEKEGFNTNNLIYKYQLMVEDADLISNYDTVFFIDASRNNLKQGFSISELTPSKEVNFSTHAVPPNQILYLCETVYNKKPKSYTFEIQGYHWNIEIKLSNEAQLNLKKALTYILKL
ncbi:MAG: hydrogenase maturation protease [Lutibacter sp.]|uniref:hydrogenase maturation protease n=1 Tax=Lutibacter sp. TaxID=1925666 RepID=UPI0019FF42D3|nr:hydrogenase maturation protease [Lutibacter sp.]NOR27330.1 hydrogenase maturation protease [Lutibacter sp.]